MRALKNPSRRDVLKTLAVCSCCSAFPLQTVSSLFSLTETGTPDAQTIKDAGGLELSFHEAMFYDRKTDQVIQCQICPRQCSVAKQERGYCGTRMNRDGTYYTLVHSSACSAHVDPIEKKPLFHVVPQSPVFSFATAGCNMMCKFCQNWQISQSRPELLRNFSLSPEQIVAQCLSRKIPAIAFTYSEPVIFYEYMYDTAKLAKQKGIKSVMISNGYIRPEPMKKLAQHLSAVKIDFKAFTEDFYRDTCAGHLQPVLDTLILLKQLNIWFELVYLMIPTLNDDLDSIRDMSHWIVEKIGTDVPLHFSRFYPQYQLENLPPTPVSSLTNARDAALQAGIKFVYVGNVPSHEGEHTWCPACKKILIKRRGYVILENHLLEKDRKFLCEFCQQPIPGLWK